MPEYEIVCIDFITKEQKVVKVVYSKKEAIDYILQREGLCKNGKLAFRRKGYPAVSN